MMRVVSILMLALLMNGCSATPETAEDRDLLVDSSEAAISRFQETDTRTRSFFDSAYAYAVFPKITKGSAGIGGAYGQRSGLSRRKYDRVRERHAGQHRRTARWHVLVRDPSSSRTAGHTTSSPVMSSPLRRMPHGPGRTRAVPTH